MSKQDFTELCKFDDLAEKTGYRFNSGDEDIVVFRIGNEVFALSNICPHLHSAILYDGFLEEGSVVCPAHGWEFDLKTGLRADGSKGINKYETIIESGKVFIKLPKKKRFSLWR